MNPLLLLMVIIVCVFSFLAVAVWSDARRKEREAYYRSEALKKVTDGSGGAFALAFLREEDRLARRRRHEGMKVGGLVTSAASIGFLIFLAVATEGRHPGAMTVAFVPLGIGLALLLYAYVLAPKEPPEGSEPETK